MSTPLRAHEKLITAGESAELPSDGKRCEIARGTLCETRPANGDQP